MLISQQTYNYSTYKQSVPLLFGQKPQTTDKINQTKITAETISSRLRQNASEFRADLKRLSLMNKVALGIGYMLTIPALLGVGYLHRLDGLQTNNDIRAREHSAYIAESTYTNPDLIEELPEDLGINTEILAKRQKANVYLRSVNNGAYPFSMASGVMIKDADGTFYVLTNHHVLKDIEENYQNGQLGTTVFLYGSEKGIFMPVLTNKEGELVQDDIPDLAVLKVPEGITPEHFIELSDLRDIEAHPLQEYEAIYTVGNPKVEDIFRLNTISVGIVSSPKEYNSKDLGNLKVVGNMLTRWDINEATGEYIQHTAPTVGGNSGGGVYDAEGRLIGINTFRNKDDYYFAVRVDELLDLFSHFNVLQEDSTSS